MSALLENDSDSEDDIEVSENDSSRQIIEWNSNLIENKNISIPKFEQLSGPIHNLPTGSSALQYLKLYLTDEICEKMRLNTNKYAEFCAKQRGYEDKSWYPIASIKEIWAFFTVLFVMSLVKMPRLTDYWAKTATLGNERVKSMMGKHMFLKIKYYFHIPDRESEVKKNESSFTFSQKVEPLQKYLQEKFTELFKRTAEVSIDEVLVKFKGRLGIIQYMPLKPEKRVIKLWRLCTSHFGYTLNFEMYCGKFGNTPRTKNGLGYEVVMHLTKGRKGAEKLSVQCPVVFVQYNRHMGGVDLADQCRKYFSVVRKSSKWWWYIFSFLLDTAVNNAFILMKATNSPPTKRIYHLYDFKLELIEELGKEGCRKRAHSDFNRTEEHSHKKREIDSRKRTCVRCRKLGLKTAAGRSIESSWECAICNIYLCQNCFVDN
ncbi:PiggyBac transposable element-derived protein like [Argiope bruennichi]|uniref:PiggyBac transposable element-derived protein like n=1 Tax=Argiope bruennichi TaxID=94029 RepID=A0A8T0ET40_ARGBR|nr:PiggyBac transposable element-derived protein like [Argiope bruennichi]